MTENSNRRITGAFTGIVSGTVGALMAIGAFLFVFNGSGFFMADSGANSQPASSAEQTVQIQGYEDVVIPIATQVGPSIVGIRVSSTGGDVFSESFSSEASGVIYSEDGYIVTNQHVVADYLDMNGKILSSATIEIFIQGEENSYKANLIGYDSATDLALLKIKALGLTPAVFGNSDVLKIGQAVIAIGSPGGLKYMGSVTFGIISGMDREVEFDDGTVMSLIQTDAALNPGNSGGALVNTDCQVVGINNAAMDKTTYEGINFAIPANLVVETINNIRKNGYVSGRAWIGIYALSDEEFSGMQDLYELPAGVFVSDVDEAGPCAQAGVMKSDVITHVDDVAIASLADLRKILNTKKPGDKIVLTVFRALGGETLKVTVVISERIQ
ncbi:MAG: S1C family serine protease [Saccharofermentanales bacterium]